MHSGPMQSDDEVEIRRNSTPRRVRLILLTLGSRGSNLYKLKVEELTVAIIRRRPLWNN